MNTTDNGLEWALEMLTDGIPVDMVVEAGGPMAMAEDIVWGGGCCCGPEVNDDPIPELWCMFCQSLLALELRDGRALDEALEYIREGKPSGAGAIPC